MNNQDDRNYDFQEANPMFSYSGAFRSKTVEGAYQMFSALFEQAEAGKTYKVYVGRTNWALLKKYLYICSDYYGKPAEFVKKNEANSRRYGYTFVKF